MPRLPLGLSAPFFERVKDRVKKELGMQPAPELGAPEQPEDPGFFSRIKQLVKNQLGQQPPQQQQPMYSGPPRSLGEVQQRIQAAGRASPPVLLRMLYHGHWRPVEGYSYRYRDKDDPHIPLFYGWCHKDNQIEAFKLKKIQDLQVTNVPYNERFAVEF